MCFVKLRFIATTVIFGPDKRSSIASAGALRVVGGGLPRLNDNDRLPLLKGGMGVIHFFGAEPEAVPCTPLRTQT